MRISFDCKLPQKIMQFVCFHRSRSGYTYIDLISTSVFCPYLSYPKFT